MFIKIDKTFKKEKKFVKEIAIQIKVVSCLKHPDISRKKAYGNEFTKGSKDR